MPHVNVIYYACSMKRGSEDHHKLSCTNWECKVTNEEPLTAMHQECTLPRYSQPQSVPEIHLVNIIDKGEVPLVQWTHHSELVCKGFKLDNVLNISFGAVSHSWVESIVHFGEDAVGRND